MQICQFSFSNMTKLQIHQKKALPQAKQTSNGHVTYAMCEVYAKVNLCLSTSGYVSQFGSYASIQILFDNISYDTNKTIHIPLAQNKNYFSTDLERHSRAFNFMYIKFLIQLHLEHYLCQATFSSDFHIVITTWSCLTGIYSLAGSR